MTRTFVAGFLALLLISQSLLHSVLADNWPGFRGPGGMGVSQDSDLPTQWSATENIVWKTELPGPGGSSPITWDDKIFISCYSGYGMIEAENGDPQNLKRHLLCLNRADGKPLWDQTVAAPAANPFRGFQARHGYASSTPATDGERVYVFFEKEGVFAFDFDGNQLWHADVGQRTHNWGSATSPVLYKDLVIVNASVESGSLVALDRAPGQQVWTASGMRRSWGTPLLVDVDGGTQELAVSVEGAILGFEPASGEQLWQCEGIQDYICPSVIASNGTVYAIGGRRAMCVAVKAGGRGAIEPLWTQRAGSNVSSPVAVGDHLYWVSDRGIAYCLDAATGDIVYQERLPGGGVEVYASAVAADGKIYSVTRESGTYVIAASPEFQLLAHNQLTPDNSTANASPAISTGQLLLRSNEYLYCID
jgi:outer membrane protein assembly factor BamB